MKVKTTVSELTRAELVSLLSAATYNSDQFAISVPDPVRMMLEIEDDDCREDVWAKALLGGYALAVHDLQADGCHHGALPHYLNPDDEDIICYRMGLADIQRGLAAAIDGDFEGDEGDRNQALEAWRDFAADSLDNVSAETLMQVIVFNQIIYA